MGLGRPGCLLRQQSILRTQSRGFSGPSCVILNEEVNYLGSEVKISSVDGGLLGPTPRATAPLVPRREAVV